MRNGKNKKSRICEGFSIYCICNIATYDNDLLYFVLTLFIE